MLNYKKKRKPRWPVKKKKCTNSLNIRVSRDNVEQRSVQRLLSVKENRKEGKNKIIATAKWQTHNTIIPRCSSSDVSRIPWRTTKGNLVPHPGKSDQPVSYLDHRPNLTDTSSRAAAGLHVPRWAHDATGACRQIGNEHKERGSAAPPAAASSHGVPDLLKPTAISKPFLHEGRKNVCM